MAPAAAPPPALTRCPWPGADPLYVAYHDEEWGVPEYDGRALFEKLVLDGFQAGLSWITILRKRAAFRAAFEGFDPEKMARFTPQKIDALTQDAGIVRHRGKIEAAVRSARAFLAVEETQGFSSYIWSFVDGVPVQSRLRSLAEAPAKTAMSERMAKDLKAKGFNFCGPTIVYAFCQACGLVNDHLVDCFRCEDCAALAGRR
ncbi:DNA-3-methyladenine glycosylase I [Methylocella sp.]|uniref:DNA-3-methyladenine glycosylase I n=1 Tax=Methylocella sp. TaxID=1978226 RepID=UPI00378519C2